MNWYPGQPRRYTPRAEGALAATSITSGHVVTVILPPVATEAQTKSLMAGILDRIRRPVLGPYEKR